MDEGWRGWNPLAKGVLPFKGFPRSRQGCPNLLLKNTPVWRALHHVPEEFCRLGGEMDSRRTLQLHGGATYVSLSKADDS